MTSTKICGEHVTEEGVRYFVQELRKARLDALANAEGWQPLVLVFERLAKWLKNDPTVTLGPSKNCLIALACTGGTAGSVCQFGTTPIAVLVQLVIDGRNEESHGGSAARRFVHHCIELSILLEDALKTKIEPKLGNVMSPNPTCVETWQPLSYARRLMLENSYTWLPFFNTKDKKWCCVSDHALVAFVHGDGARARLGMSLNKAISGTDLSLDGGSGGVPQVAQASQPASLATGICASISDEPKLSVQDLETSDASALIDVDVISRLSKGPVLVTSGDEKHVVGIVTAFDLL